MAQQQFYSISEAAKFLDVTTKTLRNWDAAKKFIADSKIGKERRYSKKQIEDKLGKSIENWIDPISSLDQKGIDSLVFIAEKNKEEMEFNHLSGDTLREKYESLYRKIYEKSALINRKVGHSGNFIVTSPEITAWLECCDKGFNPVNYDEPKDFESLLDPVQKRGIINCRWMLYSSRFLDPSVLLIGLKTKKEVALNTEALMLLQVKNFIL